MTNRLLTRNFAVFAAAAFALTGATLRADDALPKAETILDRYVEVTGGKAVYQNLKSEITTGTVEIAGMGLKGPLTHYAAEPDKSYLVIELDGIGKIEQGAGDGVAWEKSAMAGAHVKSGVEKAQSIREAAFNGSLNWRKIFSKVETVGVEPVAGEDCYKLILTPNEGKPETHFYSKKSGLLLKGLATVEGPTGEIEAESTASDYKDFGGVLLASKMTQKVGPQEITMTIDSVKWNEKIPADKFEPPADVKALMAKPAAK